VLDIRVATVPSGLLDASNDGSAAIAHEREQAAVALAAAAAATAAARTAAAAACRVSAQNRAKLQHSFLQARLDAYEHQIQRGADSKKVLLICLQAMFQMAVRTQCCFQSTAPPYTGASRHLLFR
jgi:hypothetical protein